MNLLSYCSALFPLLNVIKKVIALIHFAVPFALLIFGSIDFAKAVIASKEDEMKKSQSIFIKRVIYAFAVFLIFSIVSFVMNIVSSTSLAEEMDVNTWKKCWNCESLDDCKRITDIDDTYVKEDDVYYSNVDETDSENGVKCTGSDKGYYDLEEGIFKYRCTINNSTDSSSCDRFTDGEKDACRRGEAVKKGYGWWYSQKKVTTYSGYDVNCVEKSIGYESPDRKWYCYIDTSSSNNNSGGLRSFDLTQ